MMDMKTTNARSGMRKLGAALAVALAWAGGLQAETLTWTGTESAVWDLTAVNWTNESGVATAWVNGSDALFADDTGSYVSVDADVELRNMRIAFKGRHFEWRDGGGSFTFVSEGANSTNTVVLNNDGYHCQLYPRVNCEGVLVKSGGGALVLHNGGNRILGDIAVTASQLRFRTSTSLGNGVVSMLGNSTVFNETEASPDVKFVQAGDNLLGSIGPRLTVKSVGTTENNAGRRFDIGRGANECNITLALTDPESEGIGQYVLHGNASAFTFDGGVVKASSATKDLFFNTTAGATPAARVTNNGVTFDTAGANTDLGLSLTFDAPRTATNVVDTVYPNDWSFESGNLTDKWSVNNGGNSEPSSAQATNSVFMKDGTAAASLFVPSYFTTNGEYFAVVRRYHTISQSVTLPSSGRWRVVYERGCRPNTGYPSQGLEMTVSLGGQSSVSPTQDAPYPFRREETALFDLEAGPQNNLSFAVGASSSSSLAVFLDAVRLERCEVVDIPTGPFVKTGAGTLVVTNLVEAGRVAVSNGTLGVRGTTLDGVSVEVANGGALTLYATRLTNATVSVAAGGALSISDNFVMNGSFEDNVLEPQGYQDYASGNGPYRWKVKRLTGALDNPGIQANGSAFSNWPEAETSCGTQTVYMRPCSELHQTVTVPVAGTYEVSFLHGCRYGYPSYLLSLTLFVDDVEVASNGTHADNYAFERSSARLDLTAGEHTLRFAVGSSENRYAAMFIDDVRLTALAESNELEGNAFAFASGATLDLQNAELIYLAGGVTVDGRAVKGNTNALRRAGVIVTGPGSIQIGPPQGTTILFR